MEENLEIIGSTSGWKGDGKKRKQANMEQFLSGIPRKKTPLSKAESTEEKDSSSSKKRILKKNTAEKWKNSQLANFMAEKWLILSSKKDEVTAMTCKCCTNYVDKITSCKNFQPEWATTGCTRLMLDSARGHAESDQHVLSWNLFLKDEGLDIHERSAMSKDHDKSQSVIIEGLKKMSEKERSSLMKKIEVAHFIAYQELAFTKFKEFVKLEERHGVHFGEAYRGDDACKMFVRAINHAMEDELKLKLESSKFIGVMADGSTDASIKDQEAIFAFYFDPKPLNEERVKVVTTFLGIIDGKDTDAPGILKSIDQAFEDIKMLPDDVRDRIVSFGADGASVNRGDTKGVISLMQEKHPWILFMWCIAHRLELSLKDGLTDTCFKHIDEMLVNLYLLYYKSPKKLRELRGFSELYSPSLERTSTGKIRPKKSSGTRWIAHKWDSMRNIFDNYGIYLQHLEKMSVDKSYKSTDRSKFIGYLRKWKEAKTPLYLALFIEILSPLRILSFAFQSEEVDIVNTAANIQKTKRMLEKLKSTPIFNLPKVKSFIEGVKEDENGNKSFQGVKLTYYDRAIDSIEELKDDLTCLVKNAIEERLEDDSNELIGKAAKILNTNGWEQKDESGNNELTFADQEIIDLYNHFEVPLRNAGFSGDKDDLIEEWHDLLEYTVKYLNPSSTEYHNCWYKIFNTTVSKKWGCPLLLVRLLFTLPVSNAAVERLFSLMKRLKTAVRSVMGNDLLTASIRICNGPSPENFDATAALNKFMTAKVRRPAQSKRKEYKARDKTVRVDTLMDISSDDDDDPLVDEICDDDEKVDVSLEDAMDYE